MAFTPNWNIFCDLPKLCSRNNGWIWSVFVYELDWLHCLRLWVLSQGGTIISAQYKNEELHPVPALISNIDIFCKIPPKKANKQRLLEKNGENQFFPLIFVCFRLDSGFTIWFINYGDSVKFLGKTDLRLWLWKWKWRNWWMRTERL